MKNSNKQTYNIFVREEDKDEGTHEFSHLHEEAVGQAAAHLHVAYQRKCVIVRRHLPRQLTSNKTINKHYLVIDKLYLHYVK